MLDVLRDATGSIGEAAEDQMRTSNCPAHKIKVLVAIAALSGLAACTNDAGGSGTELAKDGTYTQALDSDPGNLNPLTAQTTPTNTVDSYAYDSLVSFDSHGKVVPGLAQSWKATTTAVTFTLRKGVTCSDGTTLTATDVAANFTWIKDPKHASPLLGGDLPDSNYTVTADNAAGTVTLTLAKPYGFLLSGAGQVPIVCPKGLANVKLLAQHTYGTGPFVLTQDVADDHLTLTVRKDYRWGPAGAGSDVAGFPAKIVFRVVQNPTTQVNLFLSGQLNAIFPTGPDLARVAGHGFSSVTFPSGPTNMFFNQRPGFSTSDVRVRRALTLALDRNSMAKVITDNQGKPATTLTAIAPHPCGLPDSTAGVLPGTDLAAAATLLDQAGWTKGADGYRSKNGKPLTIRLAYGTGLPSDAAATELMGAQWKKLGVHVELVGQASNAFLQTLFGGSKWDAAYLFVGIATPNQFMQFASGPTPAANGQNFAAIANPEYDRLSQQAQLALPGQGGCALWSKAERALFADLDVVPLATRDRATYFRGVKIVGTQLEPTSIRVLK